MTDALIVLCTCTNTEEAERIARPLVEQRFAACVNILPAVRSIYRWQDKVESASEVLLIIKSTTAAFPLLRDRITELHSYDVPEIIALPIVDGTDAYLSWLRAQVN